MESRQKPVYSARTWSRRAFVTVAGVAAASGTIDVRQQGASGRGERLDTAPIQKAIEACAAAGGGSVVFPPGRYLTGTIFLRDRVTLQLEAGAVLLGSPRLDDYPVRPDRVASYTRNYTERCLIRAEGVRDTGIQGAGEIDGNGQAFAGPYKVRPYLIRFVSCSGVQVSDVTLRNSPMWVQHYLDCEDVLLTRMRVRSRRDRVNNDGIDVDSCRRVRISDCDIDAGDDAIVLKATMNTPCRDIVVTNCILSTLCNAFKLGTESNGGFDNIVFSNSVIRDTRLAGIAIESVDGGFLTRVGVSGIVMRDVGCPLFVRLADRGRPVASGDPRPGKGTLNGVTIRDVQASAVSPVASSITGLPGQYAADVLIDGLRILAPGGGTAADIERAVPERPGAYPEYSMFGHLPAFGLYLRHARGLTLSRVDIRSRESDARPSLAAEDVEDLTIAGWRGAMRLADVRGVRLSDLRGSRIALSGPRTQDVETPSGTEVSAAAEVSRSSWRVR